MTLWEVLRGVNFDAVFGCIFQVGVTPGLLFWAMGLTRYQVEVLRIGISRVPSLVFGDFSGPSLTKCPDMGHLFSLQAAVITFVYLSGARSDLV